MSKLLCILPLVAENTNEPMRSFDSSTLRSDIQNAGPLVQRYKIIQVNLVVTIVIAIEILMPYLGSKIPTSRNQALNMSF